MYQFIINPGNNSRVDINSKLGKTILKNYIKQLGGKYVAKGTYKCVFNPPIKCKNLSGKPDVDYSKDPNYVSAIMQEDELSSELNELSNVKLSYNIIIEFQS